MGNFTEEAELRINLVPGSDYLEGEPKKDSSKNKDTDDASTTKREDIDT